MPSVQSGDDLSAVIIQAMQRAGLVPQADDVVVVAQKIVSKAEGRMVNLAGVTPTDRAREVAAQVDKDPRVVELVLQESDEISRMRPGVLIVRHRLGFTSANAGIDRSNVDPDDNLVLLLPEDPDHSARQLRSALEATSGARIAVLIVDSMSPTIIAP